MRGSIRILIGLLIVFGAIGKLDTDPAASILVQGMLALLGWASFTSASVLRSLKID